MRLPRRVQALLVFFVVLVVAALGLDIGTLAVRERASDRLRSTLVPARLDLERLGESLVEQEAAERGYLITGRESYLEPFEEERAKTSDLLDRLRAEVDGRRDLEAAVDRLRSKINAWQSVGADFEINAKRLGRDEVVTALVAGGTSTRLFTGLRTEIDSFASDLDVLSSHESDDIERLDRVLILIDAATLVLAIVLLSAAAVLARRWFLRPLDALSESVQLVAAGALRSTVSVTGPPEFRELAADVDAMRRRILAEVEEAERAREALADRGMIVLTLRDELGATTPLLPPGLEVTGRFLPAQGIVAGDWYDVMRLGEDRVAMALVDVSGHGAGVGAFALRTKTLALAAMQTLAPGDVLAWMASRLGDTGEQFLTGVVVDVDGRTGAVRYASAGHPPMLLGGVTGVVELGPTGPLLGPVPGTWATAEIEVPRGGVLVAFSDGLLEARDSEGAPFGLRRLREIVEATQLAGADAVADACMAAVTEHQATRADDLTLVVVGR
jgi:sigma-B regulation protein RsbU (phosphoserine phosphatase)